MKNKLTALIITGVIIFGGSAYLYDQMYDCLFPPTWLKIPRSYSLGDCLQKYADGTLPDFTKTREDHAEKQALKMELIERYKDMPEVVAFYAKYDDANVSVRDDHLSYFTGHEDDFVVRMNLYFDKNYELDYIQFHCYVGRELQDDVAQTFILRYLKDYDCKPDPVRTPPPEPPFEKKEPQSKIEVMFGEKLDDGLLPVTFTEVTTHAETLDEITVWNFELIGHSGDDRKIVWDTLPEDKRVWYEITDDDGLDIRMPENVVIPADQHIYQMDCGSLHKEGESAHPTLLQIKNNTSTIYAKNSQRGIYPDSNGEYSFEFASIFEHYVRFPEDSAEIIFHNSMNCKLTQNIEDDPQGKYTDGYYTTMVFSLD